MGSFNEKRVEKKVLIKNQKTRTYLVLRWLRAKAIALVIIA